MPGGKPVSTRQPRIPAASPKSRSASAGSAAPTPAGLCQRSHPAVQAAALDQLQKLLRCRKRRAFKFGQHGNDGAPTGRCPAGHFRHRHTTRPFSSKATRRSLRCLKWPTHTEVSTRMFLRQACPRVGDAQARHQGPDRPGLPGDAQSAAE